MTDNRVTITLNESTSINHNDANELEQNVKKKPTSLHHSKIVKDSFYLNTDSNIDTKNFRNFCYQEDRVTSIQKNIRNDIVYQHEFDELLHTQ